MIGLGLSVISDVGSFIGKTVTGYYDERYKLAVRLEQVSARLEGSAKFLRQEQSHRILSNFTEDIRRLTELFQGFDIAYGAPGSSLTDFNVYPRKAIDKLNEACGLVDEHLSASETEPSVAYILNTEELLRLTSYIRDCAHELVAVATRPGFYVGLKQLWRAKECGWL